MLRSSSAEADLRRSIERHYDSLALLYRTLWGEHIHHGLWLNPSDQPRRAQLRLVEYLAERAAVREREYVLDIGCGYGAPARWLSRQLGCSVIGITISGAQARLARRFNERAGDDDRIFILRGDAASLPFADAAFDLIWVIECIEHLSNKRRFVGDAARLLRRGGRLALCSWQRGEGILQSDRLVQAVCRSFLCPSLASQADYRAWCAEAGLEVQYVEDLTSRVAPTWEILLKRVGRPWLAPITRLLGPEVKRFVAGFPQILEAYRRGTMSYGLLVATAP